jgi:hypothetical protein
MNIRQILYGIATFAPRLMSFHQREPDGLAPAVLGPWTNILFRPCL